MSTVGQVTVKDIARRLNLHYTTVSKALRDHPDISSTTRTRVQLAARVLDYHPNLIAKSLKRQATLTLAVIVPSIKNDFFSAVISGIEEIAYGRGFNTIVCQSNEDSQREAIHIRTLIANRVAGVLVSVAQSTKSGAHFVTLQKQGIPLVFFDRVCDDVEADKVVVDDYGGAVQAVEHLIRSGYKTIAHLAGYAHTSIGRERCRGYLDALRRHGLGLERKMIVYGGFEEPDGIAGVRRIMALARRPEAIFAVNDPVAAGAHSEAKRCGLTIPRDMALVGFGDVTLSSYLDPPLTTIAQSPYKQGKAAANMLLRRIGHPDGEIPPEVEVIETNLVLRKSA